MSDCIDQMLAIQDLITDCGYETDGTPKAWCDNQAVKYLIEHPRSQVSSKPLEVRYHYMRDLAERGLINIPYIPSADNIADGLTKPLARQPFEAFRRRIQVVVDDRSPDLGGC